MPEPSRTQPNPQRNSQRPPQHRNTSSAPIINGSVLGAVILGICLIVAASIVKGSVAQLTTAVKEQSFSSSFSAPSRITVDSSVEKQYFTLEEASAYLNISTDELKAAMTKGDLEEYVQTSNGYSIAKDKLDKYFENRAYKTMTDKNASASSEEN